MPKNLMSSSMWVIVLNNSLHELSDQWSKLSAYQRKQTTAESNLTQYLAC